MEDSQEKEELVIFNCKMEPELREKFKIKTIKEKTTMAEVVIGAIKEYLKE